MYRRSVIGLGAVVLVLACDDASEAPPSSKTVDAPEVRPEVEPVEPVDYGPPPTPDAPAPPASPAPAGFALLPGGAVLNPTANEKERVMLPGSESVNYVWQVVESTPDTVTLRNMPLEDMVGQCANPMVGLANFELKLSVPREQLLSVVRAPWAATFADGTSVSIRPGARVGDSGERGHTILDGNAGVTVALDDAFFGRWFEAATRRAGLDDEGTVDFRSTFRYGRGQTLDFWTWPLVRSSGDASGITSGAVEHYGEQTRDGKTLTRFRTRCLEVVTRADPDASPREGARPSTNFLDGVGMIGGNTPMFIPKGTPVLWPDGTKAGTVVHDHMTPNNLWDFGTLRCWHETVTTAYDEKIRLCIDPSEVTLPPTPSKFERRADPKPPEPKRADFERLLPERFGVKGSRSHDDVQAGVKARLRAIHRCYATALLADKSLAGTVEVQFDILASGKVRKPRAIRTTLEDDAVGTCVAKQVGKIKFGKGGKSNVVYPFEFSPR